MSRAVMQQALDALEKCSDWPGAYDACSRAVHNLRQALAEPEQEPEPLARAWQEGYNQGVNDERTSEANIGIAGFGAKVEPARQNPYRLTAPTPRKPLTDEEIWNLAANCLDSVAGRLQFARAIEAAHGIGEQT